MNALLPPVEFMEPIVLPQNSNDVNSHDFLQDLYDAAACNAVLAGQCIMMELIPESKDICNLIVALGGSGTNGHTLVERMKWLMEFYFEPLGFADTEGQFKCHLERLDHSATLESLINLFLLEYLHNQNLPLPCLSIFQGQLLIRDSNKSIKYIIHANRHLGNGAFGSVYECSRADGTGPTRAIKIIDLFTVANRQPAYVTDVAVFMRRIMRECLVPQHVKFPGMVNYVDHLFFQPRNGIAGSMDTLEFLGGKLFIIMELAPGGEIFDIMKDLSVSDIKNAMSQAGRTLLFLHSLSSPIIHRDVKPENISFSRGQSGQICCKIMDFGLSRTIGFSHSQMGHTHVGTELYSAPEIHGREHDTRVDVYSFGMCLAVMFGGTYPHREMNSGPDFRHALIGYRCHDSIPVHCCTLYARGHPCDRGQYWNEVFSRPGLEGARELIERLCDPDPENRIGLEEALRDGFWGQYALNNEGIDEIRLHVLDTNARIAAAAAHENEGGDAMELDYQIFQFFQGLE